MCLLPWASRHVSVGPGLCLLLSRRHVALGDEWQLRELYRGLCLLLWSQSLQKVLDSARLPSLPAWRQVLYQMPWVSVPLPFTSGSGSFSCTWKIIPFAPKETLPTPGYRATESVPSWLWHLRWLQHPNHTEGQMHASPSSLLYIHILTLAKIHSFPTLCLWSSSCLFLLSQKQGCDGLWTHESLVKCL